MDNLPFVDEHRVLVKAPALEVWQALTSYLPRFASGGMVAQLLATEPRHASGTPLSEGAALPGFAVAEADPGRRLRLTGRHRFSRYALTLTLDPQPGATVLSARTDAAFPGSRGMAYRALVIGSGAHRYFVRRLLQTVRRQAEGT